MKRQLEIMLFILINSINIYSQGENNIWFLAPGLALDFGSGSPQTLYEGMVLNRHQQISTVCDSNGNLLFYCDGEVVRNRRHEAMPNGSGLIGFTLTGFQAVLATPSVMDQNVYYVFTVDYRTSRRFEYSVVDLRLNGGLGDIVSAEKHIHLSDGIGPGITSLHGSCNDMWVLVHDAHSSNFLSFRISSEGLTKDPVVSSVGHPIDGSSTKIMAAPNSKRIALGHSGLYVEVLDFDAETGRVSEFVFLDNFPAQQSGWDAFCFSPDSRLLYIGIHHDAGSGFQYRILQYALHHSTADSVWNSMAIVGTAKYPITDMQIGPDGKIYVATHRYIGVINDPNVAGPACNFVDSALYFGSLYRGQGLQNLVVVPDSTTAVPKKILPRDTILCSEQILMLDAAHPQFDYLWNDGSSDSTLDVVSSGDYWVEISRGLCTSRDTISVTFTETPQPDLGPDFSLCPGESYTLDPALASARIIWSDSLMAPTLTVDRPGTYDVLAVRDGCTGRDTVEVALVDPPELLMGDTVLCPGDFLDLSVQASHGTVTWDDGTVDPVRRVAGPGVYSVEVTVGDCSFRDTVIIEEGPDCVDDQCAVYVPNVFSPNGDGLNDALAVQTGCPLEYYELNIFNRWGELVFQSMDINETWTARGHDLPDVFVYLLKYRTPDGENIVEKGGDITLMK